MRRGEATLLKDSLGFHQRDGKLFGCSNYVSEGWKTAVNPTTAFGKHVKLCVWMIFIKKSSKLIQDREIRDKTEQIKWNKLN